MRWIIGGCAALMLVAFQFVAAQEKKPAIPPGAAGAAEALKNSPRHGEWVDIVVPGSETKLRSYVVYPERKDKAPVVIVIHEIFGLTDWIRSVADQLAAEGYIAIAPDLLSGKGPDGGGTSSFEGDSVREAVRGLKDDEVIAGGGAPAGCRAGRRRRDQPLCEDAASRFWPAGRAGHCL